MTNLSAVREFVGGREAQGSNLRSTGNELISYSTVIAQYENGGQDIAMTSKKYSRTTSAHQNLLRGLYPDLIEREAL